MAELNDAVKPRLAALYDRAAPLLTKRGRQIVDRALKKGTVGGDVGMRLLFEPAMLLSLVADGDLLYEFAEVARSIPFIRDYGLWAPCEAIIAAAYRVLTVAGDPRADEVQSWLSLPENEGVPGLVVVHQAMTNRLGGLVVEQIRSDAYTAPLKLPQLSYVIAKLRELSVMWAFGGSTAWPRTRIEEEIDAIRQQVSDLLA
jgi:hypothetical protein